MIDDDQINEALDRIARTDDGELLYRFMQKTLMGTIAEHDPSEGALRTEHGMRRFAASLMAKMAKGIDARDGRTDSSSPSPSPSERTVVFRAREPRRVASHVSARDHLRQHDPELAGILRLAAGDGNSD